MFPMVEVGLRGVLPPKHRSQPMPRSATVCTRPLEEDSDDIRGVRSLLPPRRVHCSREALCFTVAQSPLQMDTRLLRKTHAVAKSCKSEALFMTAERWAGFA